MTESTGLVERLRKDADFADAVAYDDCWEIKETERGKRLRAAASRIEALEAEVALLREALEPFAFEYDHRREHMGHEPDDWPAFRTAHQITMGHLRRARAALGGKP